MSSNNIVLVVAAHPDDEVLGCGGTLARRSAEGDSVYILFLAEGVTARYPSADLGAAADEIEAREAAARQAAKQMGAEEPRFVRNPDNRLDTVPLIELSKEIEKEIASLTPSVIYTHHGGDLNLDHRRVHDAVVTACRPVAGHPVKSIYSFEVLSSTEWTHTGALPHFRPQYFVDISDYMDRKLAAIEAYDVEMRSFPHPRSPEAVKALAQFRGAASGCPAAEGFVLLRQIV